MVTVGLPPSSQYPPPHNPHTHRHRTTRRYTGIENFTTRQARWAHLVHNNQEVFSCCEVRTVRWRFNHGLFDTHSTSVFMYRLSSSCACLWNRNWLKSTTNMRNAQTGVLVVCVVLGCFSDCGGNNRTSFYTIIIGMHTPESNTHMHSRTHACTHTQLHARTHTHIHTHTRRHARTMHARRHAHTWYKLIWGERQWCISEESGEEKCLQFAFEGRESKRVPGVLGEIIPDVGTCVWESAIAMGSAFEALQFEHGCTCVWRRAERAGRAVQV